MSATSLILAGFVGAFGVWLWDMRKRAKSEDQEPEIQQTVRKITGRSGTTRFWDVN